MVDIKVFGERNSGTTYLERLLEENVDCRQVRLDPPALLAKAFQRAQWLEEVYLAYQHSNHLGWKHGIPDRLSIADYASRRRLAVITISKNPYSYLLSLYRHPYHLPVRRMSFDSFLQTRFPLRPRDWLPEYRNCTPAELWNRKNAAYLELQGASICPVAHTQYEALLENTAHALGRLCRELGLPMKRSSTKDVRQVEASTKNSLQRFADYRRYYLEREWLRELTARQVDVINEQLDHRIVLGAGYSLL